MYLLNTSTHRANLYLATFSEKGDEIRRLNKAASPVNIATTASSAQDYTTQARLVAKTIDDLKNGREVSDGRRLQAENALRTLSLSEIQSSAPGNVSGLQGLIDNTAKIELETRTDPRRIRDDGTSIPNQSRIPSDSALGSKLREVVDQRDAETQALALRQARLTPGSEEDTLRLREKLLLENNAAEIARKQETLRPSQSVKKGQVTVAKKNLRVAIEDARSRLIAEGNPTPTVKQVQEAVSYGGSKKTAPATLSQLQDRVKDTMGQRVVYDKNERKLKEATSQLSKLNTPESWASQIEVPRVTTPIPAYAVTEGGKILPDRVQVNPNRGQGLVRRLDTYRTIQDAAKTGSLGPDGSLTLPNGILDRLARGESFSPAPPTPKSVSIPVTGPTKSVPSLPRGNVPTVPTNPTKAPTFLQSLKNNNTWIGKVPVTGPAASANVSNLKNNVTNAVNTVKGNLQQRVARVQQGKANRASVRNTVPSGPTPAASGVNAPAQSSVPFPRATKPTAKQSRAIKGKVTTPKGDYTAEVTVPAWLQKAGSKASTKTPAPKVKEIKIANSVRDGNLLGKAKDFYSNLSSGTKKTALGGALALGGIGLLAAGSNRASKARGEQENRARELAAIAQRPPQLPENQLPYSPYDYPGYNY